MDTDFLDAHERHWKDAESLFRNSRWANADHLYGVAAECGLKKLMVVFGMKTKPHGKPEDERDCAHANKVWARYDAYRSKCPFATAYGLPPKNLFHDWDVCQRYAKESHFDRACAERHQAGAALVRRLLSQAKKDGLI